MSAPVIASSGINDLSRAAVIARIKSALKRRSGKAWSVTGGSGTAYGWLRIDVPPAQRTWKHRLRAGATTTNTEDYEDYDSGQPGGLMSPAARKELALLLGFDRPVHCQGVSIASSNDYYREYIDRAEGRAPSKIATPYWD